MKIPILLLTALSAAVLSSCEKETVQPCVEDPQPSSETVQPVGGGNNSSSQPDCCPACGMG